MTPKRTTTMRLDDDLLDGLQVVKERDGINISEQVRRAILAWLETKGVKKTERPRGQKRKRS